MNLTEITTAINAGGVVLLLAVALIGGFREWWVYGPAHRAIIAARDAAYDVMVKDRDEWKALAMHGLQAADKATTVAKAAVTPGPFGEP